MSNRHLPIGTRDEFGPRAIRKENLIQTISQQFIQAGSSGSKPHCWNIEMCLNR